MDTVFSVVVLTAIGLVAGAIWLFRRGGADKQAWLMLVLAAVMLGNVLIWALPQSGGTAPLDRAAQGGP
jgi:hypothetical protein